MSLRRFLLVVREELVYNLKRPSFWIMLLLVGLLVWGFSNGNVRVGLASGDSSVGGKKAYLTSEFALTQVVCLVSFILFSFFAAVAAGLAVIRDLEWKAGEILHATPLTAAEYVWGKFIGVLATFVIGLALTLGLMILFFQLLPNSDMLETRGQFALRNYIVPLIMMGLPIVVFACGTSFGVGTRTRRPILVFVLPIILLLVCGFFLWSWTPTWLDPRVDRALMLIDPSGFRWLLQTWFKIDRGVDFYNTQPVTWDTGFVLSRIGIVLVGLVSTGLAARHFRRTLRSSGKVTTRAAKSETPPTADLVVAPTTTTLGSLGMTASAPTFWRGFRLVAGAELKELRSSPGLYLFVPIIVWQTLGNALLAIGAFDTPLLLTPGTLAVRAMGSLITLVSLLIVFYAVESLERERATGFSSIHDALPVSAGSILAGKAVALGVVTLSAIGAVFLGSAIALLIQGRVGLDPRPFIIVWGLLLLPGIVMWTCFVFAAYAVARNRYTTYGITLAAFGATVYLALTDNLNWIDNWPLWGALEWSDMSVFEFDRTALLLNRLFVLSLAVVFLRFAIRHFPRRDGDSISVLHALRPAELFRSLWQSIPWLAVPILLAAAILHQISIGPNGDRAEKKAKDYWRKNLATWTDAPLPALADAEVDVAIDPARRAWRVKGQYLLVNKQNVTLREIPLTVGHWDEMKWEVNGASAKPDTASHLFVFTPSVALAPGDSLRIGFSYSGVERGSTRAGGGASEFIVPSGVVMTSFGPRWFPMVGYDEAIGVEDENRAEPKQYAKDFYEGTTPPAFGSQLPMTVRMTITTPADFTANGVGEKISEEIRNGLKITTWKTDHPVMAFNVVAGRFSVKTGQGTALYYSAAHSYNTTEMIGALDAARKHFGDWFAPYPWKVLKVSEFPALAGYAQGFPTNISFSEQIGFLTKSEPKTNLAFLVTAHETAHQWWGNMLQPGRGPSGNILSEGMSHFATALLLARVKGDLPGMEFRKRIESRYADNRQSDAERSLARTDGSHDGDETVMYDKGGFVFWMLWDLMGADRNFAGLRQFITDHQNNPDHAVLHDFKVHMRRYATDVGSYDQFVNQWLDSVVVPEYRISEARSVKTAGGWKTSVRVTNIGTGIMPIEVAAVIGDRPLDPTEKPKAAYRAAKATIVLGSKEWKAVTIESSFKPDRVVVDPDVRVLQLRRAAAELKL
ncbi:MAG: ABC transporter permease subunit [Anaerolineae bacterium]|nr:ABC transporter permease subunit [Gemmatimonadaceae bacterium]